MAKFFKSDWFKCVAFLLILSVVLCGTLAILNDVLFVDSTERTARALNKIYDREVDFTTSLDIDNGDTAITNEYGQIEKIYQVENDLVFKSVGFNGYKNGTITLWVKVINDKGQTKIDKVIQDSFTKQTLMSKFTSEYYDNFLIDVTAAFNNGTYIFSSKEENKAIQNAMSGATYSATAACNAINSVIVYLGGK